MALKIDGITTIATSPSGYWNLPAGTTLQRPATPIVGMSRYNTDTGYVEVYTTTGWRYINFATIYYGERVFTASTPWIVPENVTSVSIVCVGGGGGCAAPAGAKGGNGGGGGGLGWINNVTVVPGTTCQVVVGTGGRSDGINSTAGGNSSFALPNGTVVCQGKGGGVGGLVGGSFQNVGGPGGTFVGAGGGNGGNGAGFASSWYGGGGGAGGYTGAGGNGSMSELDGVTGAGGGGGGGGASFGTSSSAANGGGGGGVGLYGQGPDGAGGASTGSDLAMQGFGGSGGGGGTKTTQGGLYGGGSSGTTSDGANGAVRVIWGAGRTFPLNAASI